MPDMPDFYTDPIYAKTQQDLLGTGTSLMAGKPSSYYAPIGEYGGSMFEEMLKGVRDDIAAGVSSDMARRGRRGGGSIAVTRALNRVLPGLRYQDYSRAIAGRQGLLSTGIATTSGVRDSALSYGGQKNEFAISKTRLQMEQEAQDRAAKRAKANMWAGILKAGIGAVGTIASGGLAAPVLAGAGAAGKTLGGVSAGGSYMPSSLKLPWEA